MSNLSTSISGGVCRTSTSPVEALVVDFIAALGVAVEDRRVGLGFLMVYRYGPRYCQCLSHRHFSFCDTTRQHSEIVKQEELVRALLRVARTFEEVEEIYASSTFRIA